MKTMTTHQKLLRERREAYFERDSERTARCDAALDAVLSVRIAYDAVLRRLGLRAEAWRAVCAFDNCELDHDEAHRAARDALLAYEAHAKCVENAAIDAFRVALVEAAAIEAPRVARESNWPVTTSDNVLFLDESEAKILVRVHPDGRRIEFYSIPDRSRAAADSDAGGSIVVSVADCPFCADADEVA